MRRLLSLMFGLSLVAMVFTVGHGEISADDHEAGVRLIAVDLGSTSVGEKDAAVAETALRILADAAEDGTVVLMPYSDEAGTATSLSAGEPELDNAVATLVQRVASRGESGGSDQFAALAAAFGYLSDQGAPAGSEIFLITGRMQDGSQANRDRIIGFADLFIAEGWTINSVMLPSATSEAREFISSIVERASGRWDDTGTISGTDVFASHVLGLDGDLVLDMALQSGNTAVQAIEVPPESTSLSVSLVRHSTGASLDVFDPHGVQLGSTSNAARFITTPSLLVATITLPEPGTWSLRTTGDGLQMMASVDLDTPLELRLLEQPPLQAGQQSVLMAVATVNGQPQWLPGSLVTATVTSPDGASVVYRLNDNGEGGDEILGDGVFSVVFDSSPEQGYNDVDLELSWERYGASIRATDSFQTEVFPTLQVSATDGGAVEAGNEITVGTLEVQVGEYPYPVDASAVTVTVTGPSGDSVTGSLRAIDALEDGTAWRFDILATPSETGAQTVAAELNSEYVGRAFSTAGPLAQTPVTVNHPVIPLATPEDDGSLLLPITGGSVIGLLIVVGLAVFMVVRRQVVPYGYIYDDRQELLIDLSSIRRGGLKGLLSRGVVSSAEAPSLPVPGARFVFKRSGPELHYDSSGNGTMRIDGRPAAHVVELRDGLKIGFAGRLFEYTISKRKPRPVAPPTPEPAAG